MKPTALITQQDWRSHALCAQTDPDLFYPEKGQPVGPARSVCMACPVRAACLGYALVHETQGVWGGLTAGERAAVKRLRTVATPERKAAS